MIKFRAKNSYQYKTELGIVRVHHGEADGKPAFALQIHSTDGQEKHDILLSPEGALAIATLIGLAGSTPVAEQVLEFPAEEKEAA